MRQLMKRIKSNNKKGSSRKGKQRNATRRSSINTKGMELWDIVHHNLQKTNMGKNPYKYKDPNRLLLKCIEYFKWVKENPLYEQKVSGNYLGEPILVSVPKRRPFTYMALYAFIGVTAPTWEYWTNPSSPRFREDLIDVSLFVDDVIRTQKFEGAASGFFKENIIIRDLGLTDKQDMTTNGQAINNTVQVNNNMDIKEAEKNYKELLAG